MDTQNQGNNTQVSGSNPVFPPSYNASATDATTPVSTDLTNVENTTPVEKPDEALASQALEEASKVLETQPLAEVANPVNPEPQPQMYTDLPKQPELTPEVNDANEPTIPLVDMKSDIPNATVTQMNGGVMEFNNELVNENVQADLDQPNLPSNVVGQMPTPVMNNETNQTLINETPMQSEPSANVEAPVVNETMNTSEIKGNIQSEVSPVLDQPPVNEEMIQNTQDLVNQPETTDNNLLSNTPMATNTQAPEVKPEEKAKAEDTTGKKKILVVDDEPDAKDLFAELLRTNSGYMVETASDGNEALEKCLASKYDLILLDIVMPNLDGVGTLSELKGNPDKYGDPIVIMLTNIGGDIAIQEALKLGAVGYKLKIDTEPEELMQTVQKALDAKSNNALTSQPSQSAA